MSRLLLPEPDARVFWKKADVHFAEERSEVLDVVILARLTGDSDTSSLREAQRHAVSVAKAASVR